MMHDSPFVVGTGTVISGLLVLVAFFLRRLLKQIDKIASLEKKLIRLSRVKETLAEIKPEITALRELTYKVNERLRIIQGALKAKGIIDAEEEAG